MERPRLAGLCETGFYARGTRAIHTDRRMSFILRMRDLTDPKCLPNADL